MEKCHIAFSDVRESSIGFVDLEIISGKPASAGTARKPLFLKATERIVRYFLRSIFADIVTRSNDIRLFVRARKTSHMSGTSKSMFEWSETNRQYALFCIWNTLKNLISERWINVGKLQVVGGLSFPLLNFLEEEFLNKSARGNLEFASRWFYTPWIKMKLYTNGGNFGQLVNHSLVLVKHRVGPQYKIWRKNWSF